VPTLQREEEEGVSEPINPLPLRNWRELKTPGDEVSLTSASLLFQCQNPNRSTQCLFCFEKNFACGYAEQITRKEGKKDIDPTRIPKKRWSLREGLEEARPPLVRLLKTEVHCIFSHYLDSQFDYRVYLD